MPARLLKARRLLRASRLLIPIGFSLVLIAIVGVVIGLVRSRQAETLVLHTFEVQDAAQSLLIGIRDAEASKRSYLLTGEPEYLEFLDQAAVAIPAEFERLRTLTTDNPRHQLRMTVIAPAVDAKLKELASTTQMIKHGDREGALAVINTPDSRTLTREIRAGVENILDGERSLLAERQERARAVRQILAGMVATAILLATLLAAILALAARHALNDLVHRTSELEEESRLRLEAEDTLRQAQKMEAVGQLTGGIAHDFNNLLTIITGNLDTLKRKLTGAAEGEDAKCFAARLEKPVDAAMHGARSAAQLTQRLLAYSRRQALEPERVDMNRLIADMLDMLRRSLGEQINVETIYGAGLWPAFVDPHQLENALLNLALNARAAMPEGGCLTIETANTYLDDAYARRFGDVEPGQYVVLCVTDTGHGIPASILDHVFEPFFSTKPAGEGSGLGLSMVHGFVKQSGGHVRIYSEEGDGTTVKVYLPRMMGAEERASVPAGKDDASPMPRAEPHETILLVEDNDGVRDYAKGVLEALGYSVLEAASSEQALRLLARKQSIDLLFTDVVLPGANGRELAVEVRKEYPDLPVLYTTGYTRNAIVHQGRLDADVQLLNKPYTEQDLARKLRDILDGA